MLMKMKEVCERTGLTERAVRLYCEKGLISPETYTQNEREYLVFHERDEKALRCIATLRAADFTLEEIRTMQNEPFLIEKTVREHTAKLMRESAEKLELCGRLQALDPTKLRDIVDLAEELGGNEPRSNVAPLKGPTFAEFCEQGGYCEDESLFFEEERLVRRGQIFARCFCPYFVLAAIFSSLLSGNFGSFILSLGLNVLFIVFFVKGYAWARVVLAVLQLLGFLGDLYAITVTGHEMISSVGWWLLLILIPILIAEIVCCYFLAFDKGVSAYQYEKRTGGDFYL
jgi:DNA-binding transcriptional MerR regulator